MNLSDEQALRQWAIEIAFESYENEDSSIDMVMDLANHIVNYVLKGNIVEAAE